MDRAFLKVRLTPRGSKNEVIGWRDDTLCIKVTAPPVEGAANQAVEEFVADILRVKKSQVRIVSGHKSREKRLEIEGISEDEIKQRVPK